MEEQVRMLKALADPTRLTIFKLILAEELCVCELQELLQISQPAVSQHMAKLKVAGLVRERRAGMWTYYQGDRGRLAAALEGFAAFLAADPATLPDMAEVMERRALLVRAELCGKEDR